MTRKAKHQAAPAAVRKRGTVDALSPPEPEEIEHKHGHRAKPISFWPLDFETALEGLLAVKWPMKAKKKKGRTSHRVPFRDYREEEK